ncbi:hypothetical protein [uncultured Alistipes sp.]|jgi:hypothetical protein|uniref:hypothetical protein n=1 Tax=uncultured Alistipes sp. TaxID=538949 RepID=UPI0025F68339|nr:hypothetical protein [uncultured Alistipes sp.]
MSKIEFPSDRAVISTDNNDFVGPELDENLIEEDLIDTEIPIDDRIPEGVNETGEQERQEYDEEGYRHDPGGE